MLRSSYPNDQSQDYSFSASQLLRDMISVVVTNNNKNDNNDSKNNNHDENDISNGYHHFISFLHRGIGKFL